MTRVASPEEIRAAVERFNTEVRVGDPVLYWRDNRRAARPQLATVRRPAEAYGNPLGAFAFLDDPWRPVPIGHVRLHRLAVEVRKLSAVEDRELEFPPPDCSYCAGVPCEYDGDTWRCPECATRWRRPYEAVRRCVECFDSQATAVGDDGQPRCALCHVQVLAGALEATGPYRCITCRQQVAGMPAARDAYTQSLCGGCNHTRRFDEWLAARRRPT